MSSPRIDQALASKRDFSPEELALAVGKLTPEEAAYFLEQVERAIDKRRIQLWGYAMALVTWVALMAGAAWLWLRYGQAHFVSWLFFIPFIAVGAVLWLMGAWADRKGPSRQGSTPPRNPS